MQFKRVDDKSIRCLISKEEMYDMGFDIDEIIEDHDRAEEFLRGIVAQAKDEVGFEVEGGAFNVQLSVMQDGTLSLMITEDDNAKLRNMLSQFKEKMKELQDNVAQLSENEEEQSEEVSEEQAAEATAKRQKDNEEAIRRYVQNPIFVEVKDLDTCIKLAKHLHPLGEIASDLYKYQEKYYMKAMLNQLGENTSQAVLTLAEYGNGIVPAGHGSDIGEEHGMRLMKGNAVEQLAQID